MNSLNTMTTREKQLILAALTLVTPIGGGSEILDLVNKMSADADIADYADDGIVSDLRKMETTVMENAADV